MFAAINWDYVQTALVAWLLIGMIPLAIFAVLGLIYGVCRVAAWMVHWYKMRRKERLMGHAKLDHIKYDILPDGSLGPGDNRNLEGPE